MGAQFLGWEDPLEEDMATHSSILAWRVPWTGGEEKTIGSLVVKGTSRPKYFVVIHLVVEGTRSGDGEIVESKVQ